MAEKTVKVYVCDLCARSGKEVEATGKIAVEVGGKPYFADVCEHHEAEMQKRLDAVRNFLLPEKAVSSKVSSKQKPFTDVSTDVVRAWARANGIEVGKKGRLPKKVIEQYISSKVA